MFKLTAHEPSNLFTSIIFWSLTGSRRIRLHGVVYSAVRWGIMWLWAWGLMKKVGLIGVTAETGCDPGPLDSLTETSSWYYLQHALHASLPFSTTMVLSMIVIKHTCCLSCFVQLLGQFFDQSVYSIYRWIQFFRLEELLHHQKTLTFIKVKQSIIILFIFWLPI